MDGAVDTTTAQQALVGGVDYGIDVQRGDVAFDELDPLHHAPRLCTPPHSDGQVAKLTGS